MEWIDFYKDIMQTEKMVALKEKIRKLRATTSVLPLGEETFNAFRMCPYEDLKIVIIGQDPYADKNHAHGLAFSSNSKDKRPKSLQNIFTEIHQELYSDLPFEECFKSNNLRSWANQGILLLNRVLTIEEGKTESHAGIGWEEFTDTIIEKISKDYPKRLAFVLWGAKAQQLEDKIDSRHLILKSAHPSPLSADKGFFGNGHFTAIQDFLRKEYFKNLHDEIEGYDFSELDRIICNWLATKNVQINTDEMNKLTKFANSNIGDFIAYNIPELKKHFEINFKT